MPEQAPTESLPATANGFLAAGSLALTRAADGLWLRLPGDPRPARITSVRPAFPLSLGPRMLVFYGRRARQDPQAPAGQAMEERDEELGILRSLDDLGPQAQQLLAEEVEKAYFVPRITRVVSIEEQFGVQRWEVETERGPRTFEITERSQVRPFDNSRMVIKDVDGNRYQIADTRLLDRRSQQWLDLQV